MTQVKINNEPPSKILLFTSKLIFIPAIIALFLKRWGDVFIIAFQAICAMWFHSSHTAISLYADQAGMWILIIHTLLLAITNNITPFLYILGFGYMLIVYSYGKYNKCFCFDLNPSIADTYHASIHILGIGIYSCSMLFILSYEASGIFGLIMNYN